ncbi:MAG: RtcB family protein [Firmicutes bacterium]|nr:RtcB family protein [Bacillota bacterium]
MELKTKYGDIKIFTDSVEEEAIAQILELGNSVLAENANIRIMPDVHSGKGCVIGTTMLIKDKVCPNLVGVDIGCGVDLVKTSVDFSVRLKELDRIIREFIPFGKERHAKVRTFRDFAKLKCWDKMDSKTKETAFRSLGTLGGGNHFIEAYNDGFLAVHSGSRNLGYRVASHYQALADAEARKGLVEDKTPAGLRYLQGELMQDYLHDMKIMQEFAVENRKAMLEIIVKEMGGRIESRISSTHNYIDMQKAKQIILRKGAISAREGENLVIPLNMRDGLLVCIGKGNADWNYSAPHGAGRLYSRTEAKKIFKVDAYEKSMKGIFSTCINKDTLDEAPFAYKDYKDIVARIEPTVKILNRLIPIYNFKASE